MIMEDIETSGVMDPPLEAQCELPEYPQWPNDTRSRKPPGIWILRAKKLYEMKHRCDNFRSMLIRQRTRIRKTNHILNALNDFLYSETDVFL